MQILVIVFAILALLALPWTTKEQDETIASFVYARNRVREWWGRK
jgi:hypothetical protein